MINNDGELTLDFPEWGHEEDFARFHEWLATGAVCEHPNMEYASVRISNWGGVHDFQAALEEAGWELFPTLHAYLPTANGGHLPASAAGAALEELQTFTERYTSSVPVLVNVETGVLERENGFYQKQARVPLPSGMGVNGPLYLPLTNVCAILPRFARALNPCVVGFGPVLLAQSHGRGIAERNPSRRKTCAVSLDASK
jgi:hypothetical protein